MHSTCTHIQTTNLAETILAMKQHCVSYYPTLHIIFSPVSNCSSFFEAKAPGITLVARNANADKYGTGFLGIHST